MQNKYFIIQRNLNLLETRIVKIQHALAIRAIDELNEFNLRLVMNVDKFTDHEGYGTIENSDGEILASTDFKGPYSKIYEFALDFVVPNETNLEALWPNGHPRFKIEDWRADETCLDGYHQWLWRQIVKANTLLKDNG